MKMSDDLFHKVFDEIRAEYPEMATEHYIIDIGAARLAIRPEVFCTDHWLCRFVPRAPATTATNMDVIARMETLAQRQIDFIKTEHLCTFNGERGYAMGQSQ